MMTKKKLSEARVHQLIEQYASENGGEIPSTTDIVMMNGSGSPSSANVYRKTYLAKQAKKTNKDPLSVFPAAIANAVEEMQSTIKAESQAEIDQVREEAAKEIKALETELENNKAMMVKHFDIESSLRSDYQQVQLDNGSLVEEKQDLEKHLARMSDEKNSQQIDIATKTAEIIGLKDQVEALRALLSDLTPAMREQSKMFNAKLEALEKELNETKATLSQQRETAKTISTDLQNVQLNNDFLTEEKQNLETRLAKLSNEHNLQQKELVTKAAELSGAKGQIDALQKLLSDIAPAMLIQSEKLQSIESNHQPLESFVVCIEQLTLKLEQLSSLNEAVALITDQLRKN